MNMNPAATAFPPLIHRLHRFSTAYPPLIHRLSTAFPPPFHRFFFRMVKQVKQMSASTKSIAWIIQWKAAKV